MRQGAPLARAVSVQVGCFFMSRVDRTVFVRIARFLAGGAAASVHRRIAQRHAEEGCAAVGHAALYDAHRAAFADGRASDPIDAHGQQAQPAQA